MTEDYWVYPFGMDHDFQRAITTGFEEERMATKKTVLARYAVVSSPVSSSKDFRHKSRIALADLFLGFAHAILDNKDIDLAMTHTIELSSETEHMDQRLVLKLIRIEK